MGITAASQKLISLYVVSIRCLLTERSIKTSELLVGCLPKEANAASLTALALGRHPSEERPLRRCVILSLSGDLEWFAQEFSWPTSSANFLCPYCQADNMHKPEKAKAPFNDFRPTAKWRSLLKDPPRNSHSLWDVPGLNPWACKLDQLHMCDLGASAQMYGSLLADILDELPGKFSDKLAQLNVLVLQKKRAGRACQQKAAQTDQVTSLWAIQISMLAACQRRCCLGPQPDVQWL